MMRTGSALFTFASILAGAIPASAQSVVSTHSGVVYYFDGAVFLGDQPLQARLGTFPSVPVGWELRTEKGKAEVLLTPGVFLRMGENSSIRMVANDLANTRVELLEGSAIIDAPQQASGTSVTLLFRNWEIRPGRSGSCRLDSNPPRLWVSRGEAEVSGADGQPVKVEQGMDLPLAKVLVPDQAAPQPLDDLSVWDQGRSDSIAADNAITQQIDQDPASHPADVDAFTYFPMLGVPAPGLYSSPYPSVMPAQPGFYSMYLPGYTYPPLLLGIIGRGSLTSFPLSPLRLGTMPGMPGIGVGRPGHMGAIGGGIGSGGISTRPTPRPVIPARPMISPRPMTAPAARPLAHPGIRR